MCCHARRCEYIHLRHGEEPGCGAVWLPNFLRPAAYKRLPDHTPPLPPLALGCFRSRASAQRVARHHDVYAHVDGVPITAHRQLTLCGPPVVCVRRHRQQISGGAARQPRGVADGRFCRGLWKALQLTVNANLIIADLGCSVV